MCRLAAYLGPPRALSDVIIAPSHSLIAQSQEAQEAKLSVNGDGFGIAWYGAHPEPGLYKDILPAWSDSNLLSLCRHISAPLFLAHVRASTEGETARANCHPFTHGPWSFMHNGQTGSFMALRRRLEALLPDELYALRRGSTDSELLFLLLLNAGLAEHPGRACRDVISLLTDTAEAIGVPPFFRQTCVFSDGQSLFCFRYASDGRCPTLYVSRGFADGGLVVASEPLDGACDHWAEVPPNRLVRFDRATERAFDLRAA
ncbi:class II glutamine amidotransferase [Pacificoceanicola onchidii]|uniref:class II glutamine amidotransferase n=1 Tax=Pacificoceanicola onchidii TaxID=2562685 RepID=UPI0010A62705|nr:class II glutamine amidotransferase [Pacificoceanicola onchidii]